MKVAGMVIWILSYLPHFFLFVDVVSIFLLMTTVINWDSSRCFHALSETKTWCISGSTWRLTGLTFHYSSHVCWNCVSWDLNQTGNWAFGKEGLSDGKKSLGTTGNQVQSLLWKAPKVQITKSLCNVVAPDSCLWSLYAELCLSCWTCKWEHTSTCLHCKMDIVTWNMQKASLLSSFLHCECMTFM